MLDMLNTFKSFLKERKVALKAEKFKVLVFNKEGKRRWKYGNGEKRI